MKKIKSKMTKKTIMVSALLGTLVLGGVVGASGTLASADSQADFSSKMFGNRNAESGECFQNLTEEQKGIVEEVRNLRREGNSEEARVLAEENNLAQGMGHQGLGQGKMNKGMNGNSGSGRFSSNEEREEHRQNVQNAVESEDYEAFKEAMSETRFADEITEEHFEKVMEAHLLRSEGEYDEAREIMMELGRGGGAGRNMM